jgi:hypothetical protein
MSPILFDWIPNEILQIILVYVIDPFAPTTIYLVARRWYDICKLIHPRWMKIKESYDLYDSMDLYDVNLLEKILQIKKKKNDKIKKIRNLFMNYKNCNIISNKINEIAIRFSNPQMSYMNVMYISCVLLLHFDSFDIEIHSNYKHTSIKIIELMNYKYKYSDPKELVEMASDQLKKFNKFGQNDKYGDEHLAAINIYLNVQIESIMELIASDICTKKWLL